MLTLLLAPSALARVLYTDAGVTASGTGLSWTEAQKTIGEALTAALAGDEIWVASGTYVQTITLKQGVALYGGFSGVEA